MAVFNVPNYLAKDGFGMSLNIRRGNPNPLDNSSVWSSLAAAQNYAQTDPVAYVGQILTVVTDVVVGDATVKTATAYVIDNEAGDLKAVGSSPVGDEKSITVAADGTVSLYGIEGLALTREDENGSVTNITYQPLLVNGKLTWVEPSATTVEGLATEIEGIKTRISAVETVIGKAAEGETDATGLVGDVAGLDTRLTTVEGEIDALQADSHTHENVDVLSGITSDKVDAWDAAEQNAKDYADSLAGNYDAAGAADAVQGKLDEEVTRAKAAEEANAAAAKAADDKAVAAQGAVDALSGKVGEVTEGKTVVQMISDAQTAATYDDTKVKEDIKTNADAIALLNDASDVEGSIDYKIAQAVAAIIENPDETMNSINELVTWINGHAASALELSNKVTANEQDIAALEGIVGSIDVSTQISDAIAEALKIDGVDKYALAVDLTAAIARIAAMEAKVANWDAAEQNAKDYADGLNTAMNTRVEALEAIDHEHANKDELDLIVTGDKAKWDAMEQNAKDYADGLNSAMDTRVGVLEAVGAEKNVVASVDPAQFAIDDNRNLTLLDIAMSKVTGLTDALAGKVEKVEGSRLLTEDEATKLEKLVLGENGEVSVSGKVAAGNVEGLDAWITARAGTLEGLSENNLTDALLEKLNGIETGAQANKIENITLGGTAVTISNKTIDIPVAAMEALGLVKSSDAENKISVATDGTMEVNSVNVNKLVQTDGDTLILNGGSANA
jgi:hypothetical protein